jgi:hypothetical protein
MADLPEPALWHDSETGHWSRLTRPSRPTYEAYYTADQLRTHASAQVAEERERCARLAETAQFTGNTFPRTQLEQLRIDIADAIRATEAPNVGIEPPRSGRLE